MNKYKGKQKGKITYRDISLTEQDKITYVYKKVKEEYQEVANVFYEVKVKNKWITIVRYDSAHGYLHRHIKISLEDESEIIDLNIEQGSQHGWLTIAVEDLKTNFLEYRKLFFERSKVAA
ncbi:MAG TPA: hypothetical protein VMR41_02330 [Patescibacteria group bacterium]|nr:hypothetical protein [Patescibacteria group bacterium]